MIKNIIIKQVKKLINKGVKRFAEDNKSELTKTFLFVYPKDEKGTAGLKLLIKEKGIFEDKNFSDLFLPSDKLTYAAFAFDADKDIDVWITKFIVKSAKDHEVPINKYTYLLMSNNGELRAFMYEGNTKVKEVSIDYILETK